MGYELNRLMQQYGLNSPTMGQYSGDPANTAEKAAYDKYRADYQGRLNITPQYQQAQFQTRQPDMNYLQTNPDVGAAYQSSGSALSPEGFARQHYLNYGQFEGRAMPTLAGGQYWGNTLQAPQQTPYQAPQQKAPEPSKVTGDDGYNYGTNSVVNKSLVQSIPRLKQLMPSGFGGGAFNTVYNTQLTPQEQTLAQSIISRGYADGGYVDAQEQPGLQDQLLQRHADIDALRQKYITDTQSQLAQAQEQLNNPDQSEKWFRLAAAFGSPTRSGTFGETLGNAAEALAANAAMQKENRNKALDLAIKGNQIGLEGAEMGLQSLQDRYKIEKDMQTKQMLQDAYISADPARLAQIGVATNNPVAIQAANFYAGRQDAYNKPQEVYDEQGNAVLRPIGEVLGMQPLGGGMGGNREPQQPRAQIGQGSGYSYAKPTLSSEMTKVRQAKLAEKDAEASVAAISDYQTQAKAAAETAAAYKQFVDLTKDLNTGKFTPEKMEALKGIASILGTDVPEGVKAQEAANSIANDATLRLRNQFAKDPSMSNQDREFLAKITVNLRNTPQGNMLIAETQNRIAERKAKLADFASKWLNEKGSLNAEKDVPGLGKINFHDYAAIVAKKGLFDDLRAEVPQ